MKPHKFFAQLCEHMLLEVSTTGDIIKRYPGGDMLYQHLHRKQGLLHDQKYEQIPKILWRDVKSQEKTWLLLVGTYGVGAIKWADGNDEYQAIVATRGEIESYEDDRAGNVVDFLKSRIGNIRHIYKGAEDAVTINKLRQRQRAGIDSAAELTVDKLIKKFRPLFEKSVEQALADIKGMVNHMLKNDAYDRAKLKISHMETLQDALEPQSSYINKAIRAAVLLAAKHHYPDAVGDVTKLYYGGNLTAPDEHAAIKKLLTDISNGDTKKLSSVIAFFKQRLLKS